ncbi:MAG: DUF1835 domain-containing protein [Flavobacteriales bacterium]|nr:DUF1835 domain-containing protein [Flavobacteriia bacterium]NCP07180.1 DUF1835 domain-containing protein [Flavobacteriales bacterium]PIV92521.1 MAG: DUF1835 domain-containing protein [Flavobacteriaceae bacterium CG17_big_fil_post_rev_8_21_14_2_50_33_15]PIY09540.1 MAG: DUF1835 domain-containing protein [Flavobacteriaceae bacterium CG_4_10_14_3_um_filter_33_47]PJB17491.1 MAG: DUF1835 domain-containing protein [Flavobacteriaceae bacterium CG_4_9_14_3_um_filter_33_16]
MQKKTLHITNGSLLTTMLQDLDFTGDILTWEEMLCEGPTISNINSDKFLKLRASFFSSFYDIDLNIEEIKSELDLLNHPDIYSEIILWFEYDLFCHINMIGVITLLHQKKVKLPIYLVSSGRIEGEKNLKGLTELTPNQLNNHFKNKIELAEEDLELAITLWDIYCGKDHNLLKPYIIKGSNFKYMSNCLKAHLERFPDSISGLNILEKNLLEIIKNNDLKSKNQLLGYALNYQGYYGYGDTQFERIINKLSLFISEDEHGLTLNRLGHEALIGQHNFASELNNNIEFGGVFKLDFQFNKQQNKLIKTIKNAH